MNYETVDERRRRIGGIPQPGYICARCYKKNLMIGMQEVDGELVCPVCQTRSPSPDNRSN